MNSVSSNSVGNQSSLSNKFEWLTRLTEIYLPSDGKKLVKEVLDVIIALLLKLNLTIVANNA